MFLRFVLVSMTSSRAEVLPTSMYRVDGGREWKVACYSSGGADAWCTLTIGLVRDVVSAKHCMWR